MTKKGSFLNVSIRNLNNRTGNPLCIFSSSSAKTFGCLIRFQAERKEPPYSPRNCHTCDATRLIMTTRGLARMLKFFPALLSWFFVFPAFFHTGRLLCEAYMAKKGYSINFAVKYKKEEARLPDYKKNPPYNPPQGRTHKKKKQVLLKF